MDAAIACCEGVLKANSLDWTDLTATIATGGATRAAVIAQRLRSVTTLIEPAQPPGLLTVEGLLPPGDKPRIHPGRLPAIRSIHTLSGPPSAFRAVAFSPDGRLVAADSDDGGIRIWHTATGNPYGRPLASPAGHTGMVRAVAFSPDGSLLATAGSDETVRLWGMQSMTFRGEPVTSGVGLVNAVVFTIFQEKPAFAVAGEKAAAVIRDQGTAELLVRLPVHQAGPVTSLVVWPQRNGLVAAAGRISVAMWVRDRRSSYIYGKPADPNFKNVHVSQSKHSTNVNYVHVDWSKLYLTGLRLNATGLLTVALSPDGTTVATGSRSGEIRVWDLGKGLETAVTFSSSPHPVTGLAVSPDGSMLASASDCLRVWEPATRISRILTDHTASLTGVQFSPDGTLMATSSEDMTLRLWGIG